VLCFEKGWDKLYDNMKIFAGTSCQKLAEDIILSVGARRAVPLQQGKIELSRFPNGENKVWVKDDVKNETVFVLQNFSSPVDQNILQFCLMVDALKRLGAKKIIGIIPWLGYAKQNKVFREGESLAAEVVAKIVSSSGVDEVILMDVHSENVKGFFSVPVKELSALDFFIEYINNKIKIRSTKFETNSKIQNNTKYKIQNSDFVVVAPDKGALNRNKIVAEKLGLPLFSIDKERDLGTGKIAIRGIHEGTGEILTNTNQPASPKLQRGEYYQILTNKIEINKNISGRSVIMVDDMILSGGTVLEDVKFVKSLGASDVYFFSTHLNVSEKTFTNLSQTDAKKIVVTDSLEFDIPRDLEYKIEQMDVSEIFAAEIKKYDF